MSYFNESNNFEITSPKLYLEGCTPNVDPKIGSISEVRFQSEISNIESQRSIKQEPIVNKAKLTKSNSQQFTIKFDQSVGVPAGKKQIQQSHFKMENTQNIKNNEFEQMEDGQLKKVLGRQKLIKFKDNLINNAHILTKTLFNEKKAFFHYFFLDYVLSEAKQTKQKSTQTCGEKFMVCQVLLPQDLFSKFWNLFSILSSFFILWLSPFINSFQLSQTHEIQRIIEIILIYQIIDGIISCNKAILKQGELVVNRKIIMDNYLRYQLPSDFLNFIIWIITYIGMNQFKLSEVLSLFQIIIIIQTVYSKINSFVDCLYLSGNLNEILDLIFLIISLYYFIHIVACLWHYVAVIGDDYHDMNWLVKYQLNELSYWIKYDYAVYWATMTMVTVGYGDITASNPVEVVFSNFTMFISSFVFAYSMNSIGMIIKNFYDAKNFYKRKLILINTYMKNNLVDQSIQNRVRNFLKNQVDQEGKNNQTEVIDIIDNLPTGLKNDVNTNIRTRILQDINVLVKNFSKQTQQAATQLFEKINYIPNDIIYNPEERHKDQYLYYVDSGVVRQVEMRTQKRIQQFTQGHTFGEYQFISGQDTRFIMMSSDFTSVYRISRVEFLKILQNNQKDKEALFQMKDQLLYLQDYSLIEKKCYICQKVNHLTSDCGLISYKPNLEKLIKSQEFTSQYRSFFKRKTNYKLNALNSLQGIQETIIQYQQQEEGSVQKDSQTLISGTKKYKELTVRRQSDFKAISHSSVSEQSPDGKQDVQVPVSNQNSNNNNNMNNNKQPQSEARRQSQSHTGKFFKEQTSIIHPQEQQKGNQNQRKISIALLKEPTYITEVNSKEVIQFKSGKNLQQSSHVSIDMDEPIKQTYKTLNFCIDKVYQFQCYFPQSNIENVILNYNKQKAKFTFQYLQNLSKSKKYTFYFKIAKLAAGMKQIQKGTVSRRNLKIAPFLKKIKDSIKQ